MQFKAASLDTNLTFAAVRNQKLSFLLYFIWMLEQQQHSLFHSFRGFDATTSDQLVLVLVMNTRERFCRVKSLAREQYKRLKLNAKFIIQTADFNKPTDRR